MNEAQKIGDSKKRGFFLSWDFLVLIVASLTGGLFGLWSGGWLIFEIPLPKTAARTDVKVLYLGAADGIKVKIEPEDAKVLGQLEDYLDKFPGAKVEGHRAKR